MRFVDRRTFLMGLGWIATTDYLLANQAVLLNQIHPKADQSGMKIPAEFEITLEWSTKIDADIDLHVIVPDGLKGMDVYYSMKDFHGQVTLDHDCRGWIDNFFTLPNGTKVDALSSKEMTTIRGKFPGRFDVGAHFYSFNPHPEASTPTVECTVEVTKLNPQTKLVASKKVTLTHVKQCINVISFDLDAAGNYFDAPLPLELVTAHAFGKDSGNSLQ